MRPPSPTNTTYSGFSNYKTDAYRGPAPVQSDTRTVAQAHFDELHRYLASYLAREPANSRSTARQKLTRLTKQQFQELSTDVYDELVRRKTNTTDNEIPFLPVRDDFHPKRNQARQKLATLPTGRFKDLSSDVYYELARRYPQFKEEAPDISQLISPGSNYDAESPAPPRSGRQSQDPDFGGSSSARKPSEDFSIGRRSEIDAYGGVDPYSPTPPMPTASLRRRPSDGRRPSQDTTARRRPSESQSVGSDSTNAQSATAGMIIPNKSTIAEEDIEVPYGREVRESTGTALDDRERGRGQNSFRDQSGERSRGTDTEGDDDLRSPTTGGFSGLNALSARLQATNADVEEEEEGGRSSGAGVRSGDDYYDKAYGRASVTSDRSAGRGGRTSVNGEEHEKVKREYEFRLATMQQRMAGVEQELTDARAMNADASYSEDRIKALEIELEDLRQQVEDKTAGMRALQNELNQLRESITRERAAASRQAREDGDELLILRERCEHLEAAGGGGGNADPELLDQLRSDMEGLMTELGELSRRNDELMAAKDADHIVIRDLDAQLKEYKRKYEQAKTELRSTKATSQLFLPTPKSEDQWPVTADGGLLDIHVTAFVSAIDSLLTAGRSNAPTRVLTPMKAVVNAVSHIVEGARAFERRPRRDRSEVDVDALRVLRERAEATLSNLVAASKTHATSSGMSPVSLLDAAASHVSSTVTEIAKTVHVRKATKAEQEQFEMPASANGYASPRSPGSMMSPRSRTMETPASPPTRALLGRRPPSSSDGSANSPPPIFDQPPSTHTTGHTTSEEQPNGDGQEDPWLELKPYLEAQTEAIVYAIQSVLSGVRSPMPSPTLNENITQIITIVSSIVAVCKDSIPPASAAQGEEVLRELSEHANKLISSTQGRIIADFASGVVSRGNVNSTSTTCVQIQQAISNASQVFFPADATGHYTSDNFHWSSLSSQNSTCTVEPGTAQDIGIILQILGDNKTPFGVKGGGHATNPGFSSTRGIQIAMTRFNEVSYNSIEQTADVGAGLVWDDVYAALNPLGVNAVGGRATGVGVAGFALGGGYSYLTGQHGLTIDNVVAYELVLPNGSVKTVTSSDSNLFFGLRGGFNNFGIVTKFTLKTYPQGQVWGGVITYPGNATEQLKAAILKYTAELTDPKAVVLPSFTYNAPNTYEMPVILFYDAPTPPAGLFDYFLDIPATDTDICTRSFLSLIQAENTDSTIGQRATFNTVVVDTFDEVYLDAIVNETLTWGPKLVASSGTHISYGLEPFVPTILTHGNHSAWPPNRTKAFVPNNLFFAWTENSADAIMLDGIVASAAQLTIVAEKDGQNISNAPLYNNYAIFSTPLEQIYGENVERLQSIKRVYDPSNVMGQAGGWKF
ncbi:hypothetical protein EUX98_g4654 [Antrodiella citrinella]|uniref:FAD-binding PCMH-type domain-containing protein n=1 Tax=Antrodiella citrinella TaxID=2447956 RepID=A0A4S4MVY0_9APHY|nr:hypothetical protein EUX98_g4654 [Antrodiella citrinella]